jgi:hypothetical protein
MPVSALDPFIDAARVALDDPDEVASQLAQARIQAEEHGGLRRAVPPLCALVEAHLGPDFEADEDEVVLALAALMYVVSPWDQTPDYLPHGLRDDELVADSVLVQLERALRELDDWLRPRASRPRRRV